MKPEFLNRIDDVIVFDALTRDNMNHIFDIQLKRVKRLLADRFLEIEVTENAKQALWYRLRSRVRCATTEACDPAVPAQPMSKAIVARADPGDTVRVDVEGSGEGGQITFDNPAPDEDDGIGGRWRPPLPPPPA